MYKPKVFISILFLILSGNFIAAQNSYLFHNWIELPGYKISKYQDYHIIIDSPYFFKEYCRIALHGKLKNYEIRNNKIEIFSKNDDKLISTDSLYKYPNDENYKYFDVKGKDSIKVINFAIIKAPYASLGWFHSINFVMGLSTFKEFKFSNSYGSIFLNNSNIEKLDLADNRFDEFVFYKSDIRHINFFRDTFENKISFAECILPESLSFFDVDFSKAKGPVDLTEFENPFGTICILSLINTDISRFKLDYSNFKIYSYTGQIQQQTKTRKQNFYLKLLEMQKQYGFTDGYEKADKELREFEYTKGNTILGSFLNWIDKTWWGYGYEKGRIFWNAIILMLSFFLVNLLIYDKLVESTALVGFIIVNRSLTKKNKWKRKLLKAVYCFFYTGFIFWGLKLDFEKLKLKNTLLVAWIIFQYSVGIVCLAYLANYIIVSK